MRYYRKEQYLEIYFPESGNTLSFIFRFATPVMVKELEIGLNAYNEWPYVYRPGEDRQTIVYLGPNINGLFENGDINLNVISKVEKKKLEDVVEREQRLIKEVEKLKVEVARLRLEIERLENEKKVT